MLGSSVASHVFFRCAGGRSSEQLPLRALCDAGRGKLMLQHVQLRDCRKGRASTASPSALAAELAGLGGLQRAKGPAPSRRRSNAVASASRRRAAAGAAELHHHDHRQPPASVGVPSARNGCRQHATRHVTRRRVPAALTLLHSVQKASPSRENAAALLQAQRGPPSQTG